MAGGHRLSSMYRRNLISPHGRKLNIGERTLLMGILNVTPDSFYDGGRFQNLDVALKRVEKMIEEGALIIDVGGESTRPGSLPVTVEEELDRVIPVIEKIRENFDVFLSIDTYKAKVADEALSAGADMINDISGLNFDFEMVKVVSRWKSPLVIMHIKGKPRDMQKDPHYEDVVEEIKSYWLKSIVMAKDNGIQDDQIILDPGIGFGKKLEHNIEIFRKLESFKALGYPLLLGFSRKSMIGMILGGIPPEERLEGTLALTAYAVMKGVEILRVHDVRENKRVIDVIEALMKRINPSDG
jgi:dihydropteroate synthase